MVKIRAYTFAICTMVLVLCNEGVAFIYLEDGAITQERFPILFELYQKEKQKIQTKGAKAYKSPKTDGNLLGDIRKGKQLKKTEPLKKQASSPSSVSVLSSELSKRRKAVQLDEDDDYTTYDKDIVQQSNKLSQKKSVAQKKEGGAQKAQVQKKIPEKKAQSSKTNLLSDIKNIGQSQLKKTQPLKSKGTPNASKTSSFEDAVLKFKQPSLREQERADEGDVDDWN